MQTQLCTYDQAVVFCAELNKRKIGDGVKPIIDPVKYDPINDWRKNGIFQYPWDQQLDLNQRIFAQFYQVHFNNNVVMTIGSLMSLFYTKVPAASVWMRITDQVNEAFKRGEVMSEE